MKKILAIDDKQDNLTTIKAIINNYLPNCEVLTSMSGKDGFKMAKKQQPDTILLDILMPGMDGFEVCRKLKEDEATKHIPVIILTALTDSDSRVKGIDMGADAFLSKPIETIELTAQVKVMLRIKEAEDKLRAEKTVLKEAVMEKTHKLKESEERYRLFFENNDAVILLVDPDNGKIIYANNSAIKFYGWAKEKFLGMNIDRINILPSDEIKIRMAKARRKKQNYFNFKHRLASGEIRDVEVYQSKLHLNQKNVFSIIIHDITERKQLKQTLEESVHNFRLIFENSPIGIYVATKDGEIIDANNALLNILGSPSVEATKAINVLRFPPLVQNGYATKFKQCLNSGLTIEIEMDYKTKWGKDTFLHSFLVPLKDPEGNVVKVYTLIEDITERKKTEAEIKEGMDRYKAFISVSNTGAWEYHSDTDFLWCSPEYFLMLGRDINQFDVSGKSNLKETWIDLLHPDDQERASSHFANYLDNGSAGMYENYFRMRHSDGHWVWILSRGRTLVDAEGLITNITVGTHIDITESKIAEENLKAALEKAEESDRLKSAFLANMSHEIRTPMNGILGFADLLNYPDLTDTEKQKYAEAIHKSSNRLLNTINDIIDISKIEAKQMKVSISETSINNLLDELYAFFAPEATSKGLTLTSHPTLSENKATILTDNNKLHGILTNLIKNAIKFTEKGRITFGYLLIDNFIEFFVEDTGVGVPESRQKAIFNRFEQADIEDTRVYQGSGLGLTISKAYVEMLGGKMWLTSEEGKGSKFMFTIPYTTNKAHKVELKPKAAEEMHTEIVTGDLQLLIVEDDETSYLFIKTILKNIFRKIFYVKSGREAVEICRNNPEITLVLMDIKMPGMSGYEATREIRKFNKDMIIIAQTAFALAGDREKALKAGCTDYISKPIRKDELIRMVVKFIEK